MKVAVTGGSGFVGTFVVEELASHGYNVTNFDLSPPRAGYASAKVPHTMLDIGLPSSFETELAGFDAVIHLAAIPNPLKHSGPYLFDTNVKTTRSVLTACQNLGLSKLINASSINAIGADWSPHPVAPLYFPVDETHPSRAEDGYSRSKLEGENLCNALARQSEIQIASLRLHAIWDDKRCQHYARYGNTKNPTNGEKAFWGWLHGKDAACAIRLCLENTWHGHEVIFVNAPDTTLDIPTEQAIHEVYGKCQLNKPIPNTDSPISLDKAEKILRWRANVSWRSFA